MYQTFSYIVERSSYIKTASIVIKSNYFIDIEENLFFQIINIFLSVYCLKIFITFLRKNNLLTLLAVRIFISSRTDDFYFRAKFNEVSERDSSEGLQFIKARRAHEGRSIAYPTPKKRAAKGRRSDVNLSRRYLTRCGTTFVNFILTFLEFVPRLFSSLCHPYLWCIFFFFFFLPTLLSSDREII